MIAAVTYFEDPQGAAAVPAVSERRDLDANTYTRYSRAGATVETRVLTPAEVDDLQRQRADQRDGTNAATIRQQAVTALAANRTDITQAQTIATQAAAIANTGTTTFTSAVASNHIRSLAQAVKILADHDAATKRQVNGLIRVMLGQLDGTD